MKRISENQIETGLIGHSEGGLIAPMAATRSQDVAFVVMMAGPGLKGEELRYLQEEQWPATYRWRGIVELGAEPVMSGVWERKGSK